MKKIILIISVLLIAMTCSGCLLKTGDELLQLPKPTEDYVALQNQLDKILETGAVYTAPEGGQNRSTVQLVDVDGDGEEEAVSFFKEGAAGGKFTVYVHKKIGTEYILMGSVAGTGTDILSVEYPVIAEGVNGIAVCWQLGKDMGKGITICSFENGRLKTILDTSYSEYICTDLNHDEVQELVTFVLDKQGRKTARLYAYLDGKMELASEVSLSREVASISKIKVGAIRGGRQALYVEEKNESGIGLSTDILIIKNRELVNLAAETQQTTDVGTYRAVSVYARDINNDGVTEVPSTVTMPGYENRTSGETVWLLDWYVYSSTAKPEKVERTFYNTSEDWMLKVPESWLDVVCATKKTDETGNAYTSFNVVSNGLEGEQILRIYAFTGDDARYLGSEFIPLGLRDEVTFAAQIPQGEYALNEAQLSDLFKLITQDWMS